MYQIDYITGSFKKLLDTTAAAIELKSSKSNAKLREKLEAAIREELEESYQDTFDSLTNSLSGISKQLEMSRSQMYERLPIPSFIEVTSQLTTIIHDLVSSESLAAELDKLEKGVDQRSDSKFSKVLTTKEKEQIVTIIFSTLGENYEVGFLNSVYFYYSEVGLADLVMREATNAFVARIDTK